MSTYCRPVLAGILCATTLLLPINTAHAAQAEQMGDEVRERVAGIDFRSVGEITRTLLFSCRNIRSYEQLLTTLPPEDRRPQLEAWLEEEIWSAIKQSAYLLESLEDVEFGSLIFKYREQLNAGFSLDELIALERMIFSDADFSDQELQEYSDFFRKRGREIISRIEEEGGLYALARDIREAAEFIDGSRVLDYVEPTLEIAKGAALAGGDLLASPLAWALGRVTGPKILASVGAGVALIGRGRDSFKEVPQRN